MIMQKHRKKHKIGIVGLGMVGDPLWRYFELAGYKRGEDLFCYDTDAKKNVFDDVAKAQIIFICVPTPRNADGSCNTTIVESAVREHTRPDNVLVIKSTVEPGTVERLSKKYKANILFNPEFLTEARAWEDMIHPDRQIVGFTKSSKPFTKEVLNLLPVAYFSAPGVLDTYNFHGINVTEAEVGKYASNVFGAMKVTFANVVADFCKGLEEAMASSPPAGGDNSVDYENVRHIMSHDARIGGSWLNVYHGGYRGFGGYCFPKDTDALIASAKKTLLGLDKKFPTRKTLQKGIIFLEAMREYNKALLESQGLSVDAVSAKVSEVSKKLKTKNYETML